MLGLRRGRRTGENVEKNGKSGNVQFHILSQTKTAIKLRSKR